MFARILVPLDGSHLAEFVLPVVERLGQAFGATVILLHVVEKDAPPQVHGDRHLRSVSDAEPYLDALAASLRAAGISVEAHAHSAPEGDVARSIAEHGVEHGADLIVLGTHGRGRVRDLVFGRIALQVLRRGTTPVLLVRPEGMTAGFDPSVIVVPLSGRPESEAALPAAAGIAHAFPARLDLALVVPTQETLRGDRQAVGTLLPGATRAALEAELGDATAYLRAAADRIRLSTPHLQVSYNLLRGDVPAALEEEIEQSGAGLVVLATHARAGLQAMFAGSIASQLISRTEAPVLLIRVASGGG